MKFTGRDQEYLHIEYLRDIGSQFSLPPLESGLCLIWFENDQNILVIDGEEFTFQKNQIVCFTEFHQIEIKKIDLARLVRFNRSFYCIVDHDSEVGCKGLLFYGSSHLPVLKIPEEEEVKFETLWKMFTIEMESRDSLQIEMLRMMLKRYIILCTRLYKSQNPKNQLMSGQLDLIREFNFLVEQHFRTKHTVAEYAELLYKSPKTLANYFARYAGKTPLQFIHERKALEAKRLLRYTDIPVTEIAFHTGFEDVQSFSRFFRKIAGISPSDFRSGS